MISEPLLWWPAKQNTGDRQMARVCKGMCVCLHTGVNVCPILRASGEREGGSWQQCDFFHTSQGLFLDWFSYLGSLKTLQEISPFGSWLSGSPILPGF